MVDRIRWDTVSYLPFYYVFFQFLLLTIFNLQANILTTKDILSNLGSYLDRTIKHKHAQTREKMLTIFFLLIDWVKIRRLRRGALSSLQTSAVKLTIICSKPSIFCLLWIRIIFHVEFIRMQMEYYFISVNSIRKQT